MKKSKVMISDLIDLVDDSTIEVTIRHIFRGEKDMCLEFFGEQNDECINNNNVKTK